MHISKNSPSKENAQNSLDAPATEAPVQAKSMTPPPFALDASSEGGAEGGELESGGLAMQMKASAHADAGAGGGSDGGAGAGGNGLPGDLKANMEAMSGQDLSDVKVHMNSDKPKSVGALAYAQGTDIHVAPGQEQHLPHEAWHTVQQKQGRVKPTTEVGGMAVNDNAGLEKEADDMGAKAMQAKVDPSANTGLAKAGNSGGPIQKQDDPLAQQTNVGGETVGPEQGQQESVDVVVPQTINIREGAEKVFETIRNAIASALGVAVDALSTQVFSVNLKFTFDLGIGAEVLRGLFGVGIGATFEASATINMQDDRLVRAGWNLGIGGKFLTQWFWFIEHESSLSKSFGRTAVYRDLPHFLARMYQKISDFVDSLREKSDKVEALPSDEWNGQGRNWRALRDTPATEVHSTETAVEHTVGVGTALTQGGSHTPLSGSIGSSESDMHFYRGENENRQVRNATQSSNFKSGTVSVGNGLSVSLTVTETTIANHANEDNDGNYYNVALTINNAPKSKEFFEGLGDRMGGVGGRIATRAATAVDLEGMFSAVLDIILGSVEAVVTNTPADAWAARDTTTNRGVDSSLTMELNFVESGTPELNDLTWALQYARLSVGKSFSASFDTEIPVASFYGVVDVNVTTAGSFSAGATGAALEIAGTNTMTYFITVYNGLVYTDEQVKNGLAPNRTSRWDAYKAKHFLEIRGLIMNLGDPSTTAYREAVNSHGLDPNSGLLAEAKASRESGSLTSGARAAFDTFLDQNYQRRAQYANSVADNAADHKAQTEANNGRTPWSHVAGGSSTVFIDMANQPRPKVLRTDYSPANQTPSKPSTIMDSLLQDQTVNTELVIKYKEYHTVNEGTILNPNRVPYTRKIYEEGFTFPKATDRANALRILKDQFLKLWGSNPFRVPEEIFDIYLAGSGCAPILEEYTQARYNGNFGGGYAGRSNRNAALAEIRTRYFQAADAGLTQMADDALSNAVISDAGAGDTYETGMVFKDEHLTITNRDGLSN